MHNLCQNIDETTVIIDSKGQIAGNLDYSLSLNLFEDEGASIPESMSLYSTADECIGKYL